MCGCAHATLCMWRTKDILWELVLPIHCGTSRDRTQAIRFGHYPQAFSPFTSVPVLIFQVMMPSFPSVIAFIFQYRFFFISY